MAALLIDQVFDALNEQTGDRALLTEGFAGVLGS